jgi:hypothetical protein
MMLWMAAIMMISVDDLKINSHLAFPDLRSTVRW